MLNFPTQVTFCAIVALQQSQRRYWPISGKEIIDLKVELKLSAEIKEPYAVIYADKLTEDLQSAISYLQNQEQIITASEEENIVIIKPREIDMIVSTGRSVILYCGKKEYISRKCLYEFEEMLGNRFMRISKTTLINLEQLGHVEPSFNGMMVVLKSGQKDYISRKYLPIFKKYLGL